MLELLVATTILLLVTGGGIATMVRFNDRQQLREGAALLQDTFRDAQTRAKIGDLPEACHSAGDALRHYEVTLTADSPLIQVRVSCGGQILPISQVNLPGVVTPDATETISFLPLYGGVEGAADITLQSNGMTYTFSVTPQGEITAGELQ